MFPFDDAIMYDTHSSRDNIVNTVTIAKTNVDTARILVSDIMKYQKQLIGRCVILLESF